MPIDWEAAVELTSLGPGEVQIWRIELGGLTGEEDIFRTILSPAEADRAMRLRAGRVRTQFAAARACLRVLLGNLIGLRPSDVPITLSAFGKPEFAPGCDGAVFFNVAHSRDTALIALCRESEVGVDLEYLDRNTDILEIARSSFTPGEFRQIEQAGGVADRRRAFFGCWTRKEAVVKADGRGLSLPLSSVEVPVGRADWSPVRIGIDASEPCPETWFVTDLAMGDGIAGAFAAGPTKLGHRTFLFPLRLLREGTIGKLTQPA